MFRLPTQSHHIFCEDCRPKLTEEVHKGNFRLAEPPEKHRNLRALGTLAVDISTTLMACRHPRHLIRSHTSSSRLTLHSIYHSTSAQIPRVLVLVCRVSCCMAFSVLRGCFRLAVVALPLPLFHVSNEPSNFLMFIHHDSAKQINI